MARDYGGFEQGMKRDSLGRPIKLKTPPASEAYRENWDRVFGKKPAPKKQEDDDGAR